MKNKTIILASLIVVALSVFIVASLPYFPTRTVSSTFIPDTTNDLDDNGQVSTITVTRYNQTWLDFDGASDYINMTGSSSLSNNYVNNLTLRIVAFSDSRSCGGSQCILYSANKDISNQAFSWYFNSAGAINYEYKNHTSSTTTSSIPSRFDANKTYNLILSRQLNVSHTIYYALQGNFLNSTTFNTGSGELILGSPLDLQIGTSRWGALSDLRGRVYNVRYYNSTLTESQIQSMTDIDNLNYNYINDTILYTTEMTNAYITLNSSGSVFFSNNYNISVSDDGGSTFREICYNCSHAGMFIDSRGTLFSSYGGNLTYTMGNLSNWTTQDIFTCPSTDTPMIGFDAWDEDDEGNLYIGEYTQGSGEVCGYLHKSTDGGTTWTTILNASNYGGGSNRHAHWVKYNSYNNKLYATFEGAGNIGLAIMLMSPDYGTTWSVLQEGDINDLAFTNGSAQFLSGEFIDECLYLGTDLGSNNDGIWYTCDDTTTMNKIYDIYPYGGLGNELVNRNLIFRDSFKYNNNIYFVTSQTSGNNTYGIYAIYNNSLRVFPIRYYDALGGQSGITSITSLDSNGFGYFLDNVNNTIRKFNIPIIIPDIEYRLKENNGTIAHDTSGNANNGTISGATWNTDGINITLTEDVDYSISAASVITLLNDAYEWAFYYATITYLDNGFSRADLVTACSTIQDGFETFGLFFSVIAIIAAILISYILVFARGANPIITVVSIVFSLVVSIIVNVLGAIIVGYIC